VKGLRWWIAGLLFLSTLINYVDRQTLSVLAPLLRDQFHMTNTDYSKVLFAFLLAYMIMQSGAGRIMDHLGTRVGFSLAIVWWSVASMLHAAAGSALSLGIFRFLLGMGEAANWPGGVKAISEWFPAKERAFGVGFFNCGSTIGATLAPPLITWITLRWGWQQAFLLTGSLGFLWLSLWLVLFRPPEKHPWITREELDYIRQGRFAESASAPSVPWRELLRLRKVWGLLLGRMLADPVWWFYVFWLPEYLKRERNFSLATIGLLAWIPFLGADIGSFVGGWLSGRLVHRGYAPADARKIVMLGCAVAMSAGIPAVLVKNAMVSLALISITTFAYSTWASNILTLPADLFPPRTVASVSGLSGTGAAFGGMVFQLIVGVVVDHFSYVPVFVAAGVMPLVAFSIINRAIPREQAYKR
jgi:ACS family hexuronate transporter-like MFS transporter